MSRDFWMAVRQAVLMFLDALERELCISPRTAELRRREKGRDREQPERSA